MALRRLPGLHGAFVTAVAPGVDDLPVAVDADDLAVVRALLALHLAGDELERAQRVEVERLAVDDALSFFFNHELLSASGTGNAQYRS